MSVERGGGVPCEAVSREGNRCARGAGHEGCHEVYVGGDGRRWWDEPAGTPAPDRNLVVVYEHRHAPRGAELVTVTGWTDVEMLARVLASAVWLPTTVYLVKHDGWLRRLG